MKSTAIIGSGISGLSLGQLLKEKQKVILYDANTKPGGLVKCDRVNGGLFHRVGGHVFNSRNPKVLDWFWNFFDRDKEFHKARRNARILLNGKIIGYPIENYLYQLPQDLVKSVLGDLISESYKPLLPNEYPHFEAFLRGNFGETLYNLYFKPYNYKIWKADLTEVPLEWLEGKLPMPHLKDMLLSNIIREEERQMVHSSFFYAVKEGSQYIANRLAQGLNIEFNSPISSFKKLPNGQIEVAGKAFDSVVYTGDIRNLPSVAQGFGLDKYAEDLSRLRSNGTSNVFCETDATDISWLYLPEEQFKAHRIIYTGNFSETNNPEGLKNRITCVVEFSGKESQTTMLEELKRLPGNLSAIDFNYEPNSYVVQTTGTKELVGLVREVCENQGLHLLGRFAEWEYYNMDKAMEAAMALSEKL